MIELRLRRALYRDAAVDEAVKTFGAYATIDRGDDGSHFVVRVSGKDVEREKRIANELGNWALGATIRTRPKAKESAR